MIGMGIRLERMPDIRRLFGKDPNGSDAIGMSLTHSLSNPLTHSLTRSLFPSVLHMLYKLVGPAAVAQPVQIVVQMSYASEVHWND